MYVHKSLLNRPDFQEHKCVAQWQLDEQRVIEFFLLHLYIKQYMTHSESIWWGSLMKMAILHRWAVRQPRESAHDSILKENSTIARSIGVWRFVWRMGGRNVGRTCRCVGVVPFWCHLSELVCQRCGLRGSKTLTHYPRPLYQNRPMTHASRREKKTSHDQKYLDIYIKIST